MPTLRNELELSANWPQCAPHTNRNVKMKRKLKIDTAECEAVNRVDAEPNRVEWSAKVEGVRGNALKERAKSQPNGNEAASNQ